MYKLYISYSTVVLHIRDHGDLGFPSQKKTPKNLLHNSILAPWQYWLGKTKPKSAFSTILKASNKLFKKIFNGIFYCLLACLPACLPACLMPPGKRNPITAKTMGLIFSLFDVASSRDVPFGIPQYVQCTHHGLSLSFFVSHFFLLTAQGADSQ